VAPTPTTATTATKTTAAPSCHLHSTLIGHPNLDLEDDNIKNNNSNNDMTAPTNTNANEPRSTTVRCITPTRAYVKECICPYGKDCASYLTRWLAVKDPIRCGFVTLPEYTKISAAAEDSSNTATEQGLKNKIRDVAYYYLNGPNCAAPQDDVPRYVALHHFHPLVLCHDNQGLVSQFLDEKLANDIGVKDVRTYIFQQPEHFSNNNNNSNNNKGDPHDNENSIVGKYICAPNYAWSSMVVNINRAETAFARANGNVPKPNISPIASSKSSSSSALLRRHHSNNNPSPTLPRMSSISSSGTQQQQQPLTPRRQSAPNMLCVPDGMNGNGRPLQLRSSKQQQQQSSSINSNLGNLVINTRWSEAYIRCKQHPSEAKQWLVSRSARTGKVLFRKLPLHIACTFGAPKELVYALTEAYPEAVNLADESGKLPLHSVFNSGILDPKRKQSVPEIVEHLLVQSPESAGTKDKRGMLALHRASAMGADDGVVNKLFRANQRGVMTRDSRGRLPKHLVMRGYERTAVRERILKKQREARSDDNNSRHCIDTGSSGMRVSQIVAKYEGPLPAAPPMLPASDDEEEIESVQSSNEQNNIDDDDDDVDVDVVEGNVDDSGYEDIQEEEKESASLEQRNGGSAITALTEEPPAILAVRSNDTNTSNHSRHRGPVLRKKNIRLNRTKRTLRSKPRVILVTSDAPATIENFTCLSKKNTALKKEMKRLKKLTEQALEERTIENFTCVSKKNRKLKREMKRMQVLTEQALAADAKGQGIVEPVQAKKKRKRVQMRRPRYGRKQNRSGAKVNSGEPVTIDKFTCMSKTGNRKLKREMKKMQKIFEEAMIAQENGSFVPVASNKLAYSPPASPLRSENDSSSSVYSSIASLSPVRSASFRSSSNRSVASTINDNSPRTIDNYVCTSKGGNKKLKEEMKRMQRLMQAELGQPVLPKKGKTYKLKKALRLRSDKV